MCHIISLKKDPNVSVKIKPSKRSNRPPCPGRSVPVSFKLLFLFKKDINKSPNCEIVDTIKVIAIKKSNSK